MKTGSKVINIYNLCWICRCAGADWHQCGHQAADAAGRGFPFAWGSHAGIAEVQGQEAQLRPAGKQTASVVKAAEIQYIHHIFPKSVAVPTVLVWKSWAKQPGTDAVIVMSITVTLLIQVQMWKTITEITKMSILAL